MALVHVWPKDEIYQPPGDGFGVSRKGTVAAGTPAVITGTARILAINSSYCR